jgi:hypothetical protein
MLGACLVKALYALPTWTRVADLIAEHSGLSDALGGAPSHWACYRFARKLRAEREILAGTLDALAASLRSITPTWAARSLSTRPTCPPTATAEVHLQRRPERQGL